MARSAGSRNWFSRLTPQAKVMVTVVVMLLLAGAASWTYTDRANQTAAAEILERMCGPDIERIDEQCIGVTDGSYLFHPIFANVQERIADENAWVRTQPSYVSVAFLNPLTATGDLAIDDLRNQLEGAYTAQRRVNHSAVVGDFRLPIQLLLANEGDTQNQWQPVVDRLVEMTDGDSPLVAVVGMGSSFIQTQQAAMELSKHRIPMVGALFNADELEYSNIPGLIRVTPSVQDYIKSLGGYLDSRPHLDSAILVRDTNADFGVDLFTKALSDNLDREMREMRGLIKFPTQNFEGGSLANTKPDLVGNITPNICAAAAQGLDIVFYAGRRGDLGDFLDAMEDRVCRSTPLTVMTGTDPQDHLMGREDQLRVANLTVVFPGRTDVSGWNQNVPGTPEHYPAFRQAFEEAGFNLEHLDDRSVMTHDAMLTAVKAVRLAAPGRSATPPGGSTASRVFGQLLNLNGFNTVPGASGPLIFSHREPGAGNPQNKQVLVFQVPQVTDGPSRQVGPTYSTSSGP